MEMESVAHGLLPRARRRCGWINGRYYRCPTRWSSWGRWVLAGAAIFLFCILLMSLCCMARRRRKHGTKPYYGTGWMAPNGGKFGVGGAGSGYNNNHRNNGGYSMDNPNSGYVPHNSAAGHHGGGGNNQEYYGGGGGQTYNAPPAYGSNEPQYTGTTSPSFNNTQDGSYGGSNGPYNPGLQSPQNAYQRDGLYPPPPGAPLSRDK